MIQTKKRAILYMVGWAFFFVFVMSLNKKLDSSIPTELIVFYRLSFALVWFSPYIMKHKQIIFKTSVFKWHLLRAILTSLTIGCTYYSYRHLPLAVATSIGLSGPLFTSILAAIFLNEKLSYKKISIILLGYFGVLCVVTKSIAESFITFITIVFVQKNIPINIFNSISFNFEEAIFIAIIGNILIGFVSILLKKVTNHDQPTTVLLYNTLLTTLLVGVYNYPNFNVPDHHNLFLLIVIGILGLSLQFFYTKAMSIENASFVSPLEYLRIVFAIPVGIFLFNEKITLQMIIGVCLIFISTHRLSKEP
jgi:drug/metabolite transporter (DMT)-like permease